jgi:hypothetical protein
LPQLTGGLVPDLGAVVLRQVVCFALQIRPPVAIDPPRQVGAPDDFVGATAA